MSIPAINRYTHGTHITVGHAMGTTVGINTMILLASLGYMLGTDEFSTDRKWWIARRRTIAMVSLLLFWLALIAAGAVKGYRDVALNITDFQLMMRPVCTILNLFALAGLGLLVGIAMIARQYLGALCAPADRTANTAP